MSEIIIAIIVFLLFIAGCVWLQIFLSKAKNKWLGLIIPIICFIFSMIAVLSMSIYTNTRITSVTEATDGSAVIDKTITTQSEKPGILSILATIMPVFLIFNIPTLIFLAIYFACREKMKLRNELDKMNVQDLE